MVSVTTKNTTVARRMIIRATSYSRYATLPRWCSRPLNPYRSTVMIFRLIIFASRHLIRPVALLDRLNRAPFTAEVEVPLVPAVGRVCPRAVLPRLRVALVHRSVQVHEPRHGRTDQHRHDSSFHRHLIRTVHSVDGARGPISYAYNRLAAGFVLLSDSCVASGGMVSAIGPSWPYFVALALARRNALNAFSRLAYLWVLLLRTLRVFFLDMFGSSSGPSIRATGELRHGSGRAVVPVS